MSHRLSARWFVRALLLTLTVVTLAGCATQPGATTGASTSPGAGAAMTRASTPSATTSPTGSPTSSAIATATAATRGSSPASGQPGSSAAPTISPNAGSTTGSSAYGFPLLAPGAALPSEAFCAAHIQRSSWEPRPQNTPANHSVPSSAQVAALGVWGSSMGLDSRADQLRQQMSGNFTGTTDEILQWVACKWGMPVDVVRAEAVIESSWNQSNQGDQTSDPSVCPPGTWNGSSCHQSYGILQVMYQYNASAWPMSRDDTAFSAEYTYGIIRACYEGWATYLSSLTPQSGYPSYHAGDLWGCLGRWYSGGWYDQGAINYIAKVKAVYDQKPWRSPGF